MRVRCREARAPRRQWDSLTAAQRLLFSNCASLFLAVDVRMDSDARAVFFGVRHRNGQQQHAAGLESRPEAGGVGGDERRPGTKKQSVLFGKDWSGFVTRFFRGKMGLSLSLSLNFARAETRSLKEECPSISILVVCNDFSEGVVFLSVVASGSGGGVDQHQKVRSVR